MLEVRLLGKFEVKRDGKIIKISSRPAQGLFAYLVMTAGMTHRREKLAGMLWPDSTEESARDYLRHGLWRIRKAIDPPTSRGKSIPHLVTDDIQVSFNPESRYSLDVATLKNIRENASAKDLAAVLSVYAGELLPGFYEDWVLLEREHVQSVFENKMARLLSLLQGESRWLDVLKWGEKWISLGQKPEPAFRALMKAHAAKGDMSRVAAVYERCVKSLKEFGIEPSEQTVKLYEQLKSGQGIPDSAPFNTTKPAPSKKEPDAPHSNLPVPLTSFIGREKEVGEILRLLGRNRLVTLMGSGGVGKTRLAVESGNKLVPKFKEGVWWVDLVGLADPSLVAQEVAKILDVRDVPNQPMIDTLAKHIGSKQFLLILDNCEHLISACTQLVDHLLSACKNLKILTTSREALDILGETTFSVPSLSLPDAGESLAVKALGKFESVRLFSERASMVQPAFELNDQNAGAIVQVCRRLSGMPLAIELAAARVKMMTVDEIAKRLDDQFDLLTSGNRSALPRHQTLRATIDWSYDLLTDPERILFRRLAVFAGGFTLAAAEAVCSRGMKRSDIVDLLGRLVDKSLVIVGTDPDGSETRYRLLETIRQYALEKLIEAGEMSSIRDGHLAFYLSLAEESEPNIFGGESAAWFARLDRELDNIRTAMEWATNGGRADAALRIAGAIVYFWFAHGFVGSEWHDRVQQALSRPEGMERTLARAKALNGIGFMYWVEDYPTDRRPELEEALGIGRELGDQWTIATALRNLGLLDNIMGNYLVARSFLEESLAIWREMGIEGKNSSAWTLCFLGDVALNYGDAELARSFYQEAVTILEEPGDLNFRAYAVRRLGQLLWRNGDYKRAIALCKESLNLNQEVGDPRGVVACLAGFAAVAMAQEKFKHAAILMASVETQLALIGIQLIYMDKKEYERNLAFLRAKLEEKTLAKFWAKGRAMSLNDALAFALQEA
jgi:non-specific serine/threonine protein kinase